MVLCNGAIERRHEFINKNIGTKIAQYLNSQVAEIKLKATRLNDELLFHIRVNCAFFCKGEDVTIDSEKSE